MHTSALNTYIFSIPIDHRVILTKQLTKLNFLTLRTVPSASPQSVRCSTSSSSSVDVSWKAPPLTEQNGQIQQYQLHFERISHSDSFTGVGPQMKTVDGFQATLTGLAPYSTYRFRVEAVNRKGAGPLSPPVTCLTDESGFYFCSHKLNSRI